MNFVGKTNLFGGTLASQDPEIFNSLEKEFSRQQNEIELIASENIASPAVMEAQGSVLTNKYAEGYPGKRYYGGCEFVDQTEIIAIERIKKLFNCVLLSINVNKPFPIKEAILLLVKYLRGLPLVKFKAILEFTITL